MSLQLSPGDLLFLLDVCEAGSLTRAAERLFSSQPSISRSLRSLEQRAGTRLVDRGRRGVVPTIAGQALLRHALAVRASTEQAVREVASTQEAESREQLVVAITQKVSIFAMAEAISAVRRLPGCPRVTLRVAAQEPLLGALDRGEVDLLIGTLPSPLMHREHLVLFEDEPAVVVRRSHRLAAVRRVTLARLVGEDWVMPPVSDPIRRRLDGLFVDAGLVPPTPAVEADEVLIVATLAATSDLVAVVPADTVFPHLGNSPLIRLALSFAGRNDQIGVVRRRGEPLGMAERCFIDAVRAAHGLKSPALTPGGSLNRSASRAPSRAALASSVDASKITQPGRTIKTRSS